ncbi:hypothetical protein JHC09_11675 [Devosia sp. MC532]|uniref:hypothetical protein n=1 Tax=Devosia sp. MC532 TaxID=2799788 RepID=UPI0018F32F73|nr:hypothetical protein [Devosia sp. MC532]MBJ7578539.1 hypothetical protein [Devosia sp. MC532]
MLSRIPIVVAGAIAIAVLGVWLGYAIAFEIYKPDEERLMQIVSAEYLRDWSSYTNLPTIKPDDCTVRAASPDELRINVYFVGICQSDVDGELITFEVSLNQVGRVERFEMGL